MFKENKTMKKPFEEPMIELVRLSDADVIATSGADDNP